MVLCLFMLTHYLIGLFRKSNIGGVTSFIRLFFFPAGGNITVKGCQLICNFVGWFFRGNLNWDSGIFVGVSG